METNVNILSRGSKIHTVSLKEDFYEIDKDKIADNIKSFIENGGYAYFSDYSYEFIDRAFDNFYFFRNFPNMGRRGRINLELKDDLSSFCRKRYESLYMPHNGWIAAKSIADADIFAYASFETIDGPNFGPVIARMHIGEGELLYTSCHKNTANQISRFIIYRVTHSHLLKDLMSRAAIWNHKINASIIDSIKRWERCRSYIIPLKKGMNTIYFLSDMDAFQIDIFDKENNLVASKDWSNNRFILDIEIEFQDFYILKVYPSQNKGRGVYSIISTSGQRIFPYYKATSYALLFLLIAFLLFWIRRNFNKRGSDILLNYE